MLANSHWSNHPLLMCYSFFGMQFASSATYNPSADTQCLGGSGGPSLCSGSTDCELWSSWVQPLVPLRMAVVAINNIYLPMVLLSKSDGYRLLPAAVLCVWGSAENNCGDETAFYSCCADISLHRCQGPATLFRLLRVCGRKLRPSRLKARITLLGLKRAGPGEKHKRAANFNAICFTDGC